jgi:hypothetical protein
MIAVDHAGRVNLLQASPQGSRETSLNHKQMWQVSRWTLWLTTVPRELDAPYSPK